MSPFVTRLKLHGFDETFHGRPFCNKYLSSCPQCQLSGWLGPSRYAEVPSQVQLDTESFAGRPAPSARSSLQQQEQQQQQDVSSSRTHASSTSVGQGANARHTSRAGLHTVPGVLLNTNTLQAFKAMDRQQVLQQVRCVCLWGQQRGFSFLQRSHRPPPFGAGCTNAC